MVLHALEAPNRLAENHAAPRVLDGEVENLLAGSHLVGAQNRQGLIESRVENLPTRARGAERIRHRRFNLIEAHFSRGYGEPDKRRDGYARTRAIDEHQLNLAVVGARRAEKRGGGLGVENKTFGTVEDKSISSSGESSFDRFRSPMSGLVRDCGNSNSFAFTDGGQQRFFLFLGTAFENDLRREHTGRKKRPGNGPAS